MLQESLEGRSHYVAFSKRLNNKYVTEGHCFRGVTVCDLVVEKGELCSVITFRHCILVVPCLARYNIDDY